ncbi:hypothetical protein RZS28_17490 [Methylocapsa polymorpha]|uniref:Uncharacterized protein n=1 Tax=Methylocapsa polymorpha TaxID=3080828 RepID=A0ABZ0HRZ8_9HYPH|nr:hypothetical protein RZS28_17490 [Methylocapsa sp. RX1]
MIVVVGNIARRRLARVAAAIRGAENNVAKGIRGLADHRGCRYRRPYLEQQREAE